MIPGSNILKKAMSVIAPQQLIYYPFLSRTPNANGDDVNTYGRPKQVKGNIQPVPRSLYEIQGLDFQKDFYNIYIPQAVLDISRDVGGDKFVWNCRTFQALSKTDWMGIDGWVQVLCVRLQGV